MDIETKRFEMIDDATATVLRGKTEAERLAIAFGMWEFAWRMIEENLRADHPDWSQAEVRRQVARRMSYGAV